MYSFHRLLLSIALFASVALAQITGDLKGLVLDVSGASVAGAKVTLRNTSTGEQRGAVSDASGRFGFHLLQTGSYRVEVEAKDFRPADAEAEVRTGETANLRFDLEVGPVAESVTVTDAVSAIDLTNAQVQTGLTGAPVQELPVGRDPNRFAAIAAGVVPVTANNPFLSSGSFNANGGRGRGNNVTVDGITATDIAVTGTAGPLGPLNFSEIAEVKLITSNFNAEYGRNANAQLQYITKSGTNQLHAELYNFFRNDKLNARSYFDRSGLPSVIRYNQYGYTVGGPVRVPHLYNGHDKTFFQTSFEQVKQRGAGAVRIANVPTSAMLAQVTDPTSRALLGQYKLPAATSAGANTGLVEQSSPEVTDSYQFSVRGDHQISSRNRLTGRYGRYDQKLEQSALTFIITNLANFGATSVNTPQQLSLSDTHVFTPSVVNEARFAWGYSAPVYTPTSPLGPRVQFLNGQVSNFGVWEGFPQGRSQDTFQWSDTVSWVRGGHALKAGGDLFFYKAWSVLEQLQRPLISFNNWDDFAAGRPVSAQQRFGGSARNNRIWNHAYFVQDDWRVTHALTFNIGVRLEAAGGPTETSGRVSNLDLNCSQSMGAAGTGPLGCFVLGRPSFATNRNWAPRFGFAWSPGAGQKTVIRGGYGWSYDFFFTNPILNQRFVPPFISNGALSGVASFTGANSFANVVAGSAQFQNDARAQSGRLADNVLNYGSVNPAIDAGLNNPRVQQFNLGIQREVAGFALKASYVGAVANYLSRTRPLNLINDPRTAPAVSEADETARLAGFQGAFAAATGNAGARSNRIDGRFNEVNFYESSANSNYHSFQFEGQRRFANGFSLLGTYTVGKSIDGVSDGLGVLINDGSVAQNPLQHGDSRAVSQFDVRQRATVAHTWELPWGKHLENPVLRHLAHGWTFQGITTYRTGFPVTLLAGSRRGLTNIPLNGLPAATEVRPNAAGPFAFQPVPTGAAGAPAVLTTGRVQNISAYADRLGLSQPLLGNFGTLGRNTHRLNGETNFDMVAGKNLHISERLRVQLRVELYNAFNNTSFQDVQRNITSPAFGQYTTVAQNSRFVQLAARFTF